MIDLTKLNPEQKKKFEEMKGLESEIQKKLDEFKAKNGITDGVAEKHGPDAEVLDKIKTEMFAKMDELKALVPTKKKIVFGGEGNLDDGEQRISFGKFLLMAKYKAPELAYCFEEDVLSKTVQSEGTPAQGGYLVPTYYTSQILGILANTATIISKCTAFPQAAFTQLIPKFLTNIVVRGVAEATRKLRTKLTFEQKTSTLKKSYAITTLTDELLQDETSGIVNKLQEKVAQAMANFDENLILVGDTGAGDDFNGIVNTGGINNVPQAGASLGYTDVKDIWNNPNVLEGYRTGAEWYFNRTTLGLLMEIRDTVGRPLWNLGNMPANIPPTVFGSPYNISSQILNTYGGGGDTSYMIFGNYENVILGTKTGDGSGIIVAISSDATLTNGSGHVDESMFELDETAYRWVKRGSVVIGNPEAFSVGTGIE